MNNMTVIYYSSNREDAFFENCIANQVLRAAGDLPIISVTQEKMKLGQNICVGDVGISDENIYRQILIGCQAANTKFVAMAEADCLYPEGYFTWPSSFDGIKCFRGSLWLWYFNENKFRSKMSSLCTQKANRIWLINKIEKRLEGRPMWFPDPTYNNYKPKIKDIYPKSEWTLYFPENPVINIKTGKSMRRKSSTTNVRSEELKYWGEASDILEKYFSYNHGGNWYGIL